MPSILTFRRGTAAQNDAFTGSAGEITVDNTNGTLRVHDGVTAGGSQLATQSYVTTQLGTLGDLSALDTVPNNKLDNNSITINGTTIALGGSDTITAGKLIQGKALVYSSRISGVSGSTGVKINFGSFTKQRSDTALMVHLSVPYGATVDSDYVNVYVGWNGVTSNYGYSYVDHENTEGMSVLTMDTVLRGAAAGTSDFVYGYPNDIGAGIGSVINPNGNDDNRVSSGTGTVAIIYEVLES